MSFSKEGPCAACRGLLPTSGRGTGGPGSSCPCPAGALGGMKRESRGFLPRPDAARGAGHGGSSVRWHQVAVVLAMPGLERHW